MSACQSYHRKLQNFWIFKTYLFFLGVIISEWFFHSGARLPSPHLRRGPPLREKVPTGSRFSYNLSRRQQKYPFLALRLFAQLCVRACVRCVYTFPDSMSGARPGSAPPPSPDPRKIRIRKECSIVFEPTPFKFGTNRKFLLANWPIS